MSIQLPADITDRIRLVIEFHRWGGKAEAVTDGGTHYRDGFSRTRTDALRLQELCRAVSACLAGSLPDEASTLIAAGLMYRRSADYVKACEYFTRALEAVWREAGCA